jgi:hypothetical protein
MQPSRSVAVRLGVHLVIFQQHRVIAGLHPLIGIIEARAITLIRIAPVSDHDVRLPKMLARKLIVSIWALDLVVTLGPLCPVGHLE